MNQEPPQALQMPCGGFVVFETRSLCRATKSFSANELVQTFGLSQWEDAATLKVIWPDVQS